MKYPLSPVTTSSTTSPTIASSATTSRTIVSRAATPSADASSAVTSPTSASSVTVADDVVRRMVGKVVSFDPGIKNFAAWRGSIDDRGNISITEWKKFDVGEKSAGGGVYKKIIDTMENNPWMYAQHWEGETDRDGEGDGTGGCPLVAVIETQAPRNVPTRVIAASMYGFLRGKNVEVKYSGSRSKETAKLAMAEALSIDFDPDKCRGTEHDAKAYKNTKTSSYAIVSRWVEAFGSRSDRTLMESHAKRRGTDKGDDLAEAFLLGYAELAAHLASLEKKNAKKMVAERKAAKRKTTKRTAVKKHRASRSSSSSPSSPSSSISMPHKRPASKTGTSTSNELDAQQTTRRRRRRGDSTVRMTDDADTTPSKNAARAVETTDSRSTAQSVVVVVDE